MKRIVAIVLTCVLALCCLCACVSVTTQRSYASSEQKLWTIDYHHVSTFIDPDTGVNYLIYAYPGGSSNNAGGMTVRYNADGTIMVTP